MGLSLAQVPVAHLADLAPIQSLIQALDKAGPISLKVPAQVGVHAIPKVKVASVSAAPELTVPVKDLTAPVQPPDAILASASSDLGRIQNVGPRQMMTHPVDPHRAIGPYRQYTRPQSIWCAEPIAPGRERFIGECTTKWWLGIAICGGGCSCGIGTCLALAWYPGQCFGETWRCDEREAISGRQIL